MVRENRFETIIVNPTSAGRFHISGDKQNQLCALSGSPSGLSTSLDVGLELHQTDLEITQMVENHHITAVLQSGKGTVLVSALCNNSAN